MDGVPGLREMDGMGTLKTSALFNFWSGIRFLLIQEESSPDFLRPKLQIEDRIGWELLEGKGLPQTEGLSDGAVKSNL